MKYPVTFTLNLGRKRIEKVELLQGFYISYVLGSRPYRYLMRITAKVGILPQTREPSFIETVTNQIHSTVKFHLLN
jgi:hypothetical protein